MIELHSWHIFLALFSIPPLASGFAMAMLPESPKFLMSRGRNEEALKVFKKIYALNTGKNPESYPVKINCIFEHFYKYYLYYNKNNIYIKKCIMNICI